MSVARAASLAALLALGLPAVAQAGSFGLCERSASVSASDQDLILRFTGIVMRELQASGARVALVSRAGTDLRRFGIRYSHAGMALQDNPEGPWAVRQLYYVCDESRPRLFDQGLGAFLLAGKATGTTFVSIVTLPEASGPGPQAEGLHERLQERLHERLLDTPTALALLSPSYSANAYAFGLKHQNCNQWMAEMMAAAWDPDFQGAVQSAIQSAIQPPAQSAPQPVSQPSPHLLRQPDLRPTYDRRRAQQWLQAAGYRPTDIQVGSQGLMFIGQWVPLLHMDDHPLDDLYAQRLRVSLPAALERFVQQQVPSARRVELCLRDRQVVVHRGWSALGDDCQPVDPQDEVRTLD